MARVRKGRSASNYDRRGPQREPYDRVLIVCEGEKTEPNYLEAIRLRYRLSNANIMIVHPRGTNPMPIVGAAEIGLNREGFDKAFCVFDRDGHEDYDRAIDYVRRYQRDNGEIMNAVPSVPCFEYWALLHYEFTTSAFTAVGRDSSCDQVIRRLRNHIPNYAKGSKDYISELLDRLDTAMAHAERVKSYNLENGSSNPMTTMPELITYLRGLK